MRVEVEEDLSRHSVLEMSTVPACQAGHKGQTVSLLRHEDEPFQNRSSLDDKRSGRSAIDSPFEEAKLESLTPRTLRIDRHTLLTLIRQYL